MQPKVFRAVILAVNALFLLGLYGTVYLVFFGKKTPSFKVSPVTQQDFRAPATQIRNTPRRHFDMIHATFDPPRRRPTRPRENRKKTTKPQPRQVAMNVQVIFYNQQHPEKSSLTVQYRGKVKHISILTKVDNFIIKKIERREKGMNDGRMQVEYLVTYVTGGRVEDGRVVGGAESTLPPFTTFEATTQ